MLNSDPSIYSKACEQWIGEPVMKRLNRLPGRCQYKSFKRLPGLSLWVGLALTAGFGTSAQQPPAQQPNAQKPTPPNATPQPARTPPGTTPQPAPSPPVATSITNSGPAASP